MTSRTYEYTRPNVTYVSVFQMIQLGYNVQFHTWTLSTLPSVAKSEFGDHHISEGIAKIKISRHNNNGQMVDSAVTPSYSDSQVDGAAACTASATSLQELIKAAGF